MGDAVPAIGEDVAGYVLVREIARGGMGVVFLARHPQLPRTEALKIILNPMVESRAPERFRQEMDLVSTLDHPAILPVLNSGESEGRLWFTMPFVDGIDAAALLERDGALPVPTVLTIVDGVAAALDHAHDNGIVHRDVKPANILLKTDTADPHRILRVYLTDFGIAKVAEGGRAPLTSTNEAYGTWQYAAPEQFDKRPVDRRTDVYALGAVLFHLLTGTQPFPAHDFLSNVALRAQDSKPVVTDLRPDLPPAIDDVVRTAMALPPDGRFPTADALVVALRAALLTAPATVGRDAKACAPTVAGAPTAAQRPVAVAARGTRRRAAVAAAVALVLATGGVGTWLSMRSADARSTSPVAAATSAATSPVIGPPAERSSSDASIEPATEARPTPLTGFITPVPTFEQVDVAGIVSPAAAVVALAPRTCPGDSGSVTLAIGGRFSSVTGSVGLVDGVSTDVRTGLWIGRDGVVAKTEPDFRLEPGVRTTLSLPVDGVEQLTLTLRTLGSGDCSTTYSAAFSGLIGTP